MSNPLGREILRGHRVLRRQLGNRVFGWFGTNYVCVAIEAQASSNFGIGGFALEADLTIFVEYAILPSDNLPVALKTLIFNGKKYRIDKIALEPGQTVLKLLCTDPNKKG